MWSVKYTGQTSVITDAYQRVVLHMTLQEFLSKENHDLIHVFVNDNLRHILLIIDISTTYDFDKAADHINVIRNMTSASNKFMLSCELYNCQSDTLLDYINSNIINKLYPDIIIIKKYESVNNTIKMIHEFNSVVTHNNMKTTVLGISGCQNENEIQLIIDACRELIHFILLEMTALPNYNHQQIELVHSRGINTIVRISPHNTSNITQHTTNLCNKYKKQPLTVIGKILMQFGCVVSYPFNIDSEINIIHNIITLCNPMIHISTYYSPTDKYTFIINENDMRDVFSISNNEVSNDISELFHKYISPPVERVLVKSHSTAINNDVN